MAWFIGNVMSSAAFYSKKNLPMVGVREFGTTNLPVFGKIVKGTY